MTTLTGTAANDVLVGTNNDDTLNGLAGNDTLNGGDGNDTLDGGTGNDVMRGGKGSDRYFVDNTGDKVIENANEGYDSVTTTISSYALGANLEVLIFDLGTVAALGTGNTLDNTIFGAGGDDKLDGLAGDDTLYGGDGNDTLSGAIGHDYLNGGAGNDALIGGAGNDRLYGGSGNDQLKGDAGDDRLDGENGDDTLSGGAGNDFYYVDSINDVVQELAKGGIDTVLISVDHILSANVENGSAIGANGISITGNDLNNALAGSSGADTLDGGKGADFLFGGTNGDVLIGGEGDDVLEGGLGADTLNGGAGNDLFLYRLDDPATLNTLGGDLIIGFETGKDRIDLYDLFEDFGISSDDVIGDGYLRLQVNGNDTLLQFDKDGGADGFVTLATLQNVTNASLADIIYPQPNLEV